MNNGIQSEKGSADSKPARFVISAEIDGFPISIDVEGKAEVLRTMIDRLKAIGAQPPQGKAPEGLTKAEIPHCPIHRTPMKPSRKPGGFFCSKRMENGEYCPEKAY